MRGGSPDQFGLSRLKEGERVCGGRGQSGREPLWNFCPSVRPVDIVNAMLGELQRERIELPAYSTLDRLADRAHAAADHRLFSWVMRHLADDLRKKLSDLLLVDTDQQLSAFQAVKASAKNATLSHLEERVSHLQWLESLGRMDQILAGLPPAKIRSFAQEAKALDIAELKDYREPQRLTLMLCLVERARVRTRDDIAEMFLRRMTVVHSRAKRGIAKDTARTTTAHGETDRDARLDAGRALFTRRCSGCVF